VTRLFDWLLMSERSTSRVPAREDREARRVAPRAKGASPPIGNEALARAISELPAAPAGRGLTGDRAMLSQQLARASVSQRQLARCKIKTAQGDFKVKNYSPHEDATGDAQKKCGVNIDIEFTSPTTLQSNQIGFVQVMKVTKDGQAYLFNNEKSRATDQGWTVDRLAGKQQGYYGMNDDLQASQTNYWSGSRTDDKTASDAKMHDKVGLSRKPGQKIDCEAITYAVDIENGTYLGAVSWGWSIDKKGKVTKKKASSAKMGPSQRSAIAGWNTQAADTDVATRNAPTQATLPTPAAPTKKPWWKF